MADLETGHRWWLRYVFVPLLAGGGLIAVLVTILGDGSKPPQPANGDPRAHGEPERSDKPAARDRGQRGVDVRVVLLGQSGHGRTMLASAIAMEAAHRFEIDIGPTTSPETRGAILVVAANEGPMPQTREHVQWAAMSGVPILAVFLSKIDLGGDRELSNSWNWRCARC